MNIYAHVSYTHIHACIYRYVLDLHIHTCMHTHLHICKLQHVSFSGQHAEPLSNSIQRGFIKKRNMRKPTRDSPWRNMEVERRVPFVFKSWNAPANFGSPRECAVPPIEKDTLAEGIVSIIVVQVQLSLKAAARRLGKEYAPFTPQTPKFRNSRALNPKP